MTTLAEDLIPELADIGDPVLRRTLQDRLDQKTKPVGSLGRLEALAVQLGGILGTAEPRLEQPQLVVFAADHGLVAQGVSAYPSDVTWQMVENVLAQGAADKEHLRQCRFLACLERAAGFVKPHRQHRCDENEAAAECKHPKGGVRIDQRFGKREADDGENGAIK